MWTHPTADVKCPRGDCLHYSKAPNELPCRYCTCNREALTHCASLQYKPRGITPIEIIKEEPYEK